MSWLRESTSSPARSIKRSSSPTPIRTVPAVDGDGSDGDLRRNRWETTATGTGASRSASRPITAEGSKSPSSWVRSIWSSTWRMASTSESIAPMETASAGTWPSRSRLSRPSPACASASSLEKPKNPHVPLSVWSARAIPRKFARSAGFDSIATKSPSR